MQPADDANVNGPHRDASNGENHSNRGDDVEEGIMECVSCEINLVKNSVKLVKADDSNQYYL
jgi:hypothetical protein